ncbi:MAG: TIGR03564 family F420-dependent LLM class oxidoreductase [Actinomycetota bacterium]|nr:TIGR03564 family F420-dependent LLM class oxidoreductase [Actinomycetota bacterium]
MQIGLGLDTSGSLDDVADRAAELAATGVRTLWVNQIFGWDALTLLAVIGRVVPGVGFGTAVVPVQARHPVATAAQALTVQAAIGGRLTLGIGLSHQVVVENVFGTAWDRPAQYMEEYLQVLMPLLAGEQVGFQGELVRATTFGPLEIQGVPAPRVLVAALGTRMLGIAGRQAAGTVTWMVGRSTLADHIVPTITAAAVNAGRGSPEIVVHLPVCVTSDVAAARERAASTFAVYGTLPSYRAMLDREQAAGPAEVSLVGDEDTVAAAIAELAEAGATAFGAVAFGTPAERERTHTLMAALASAR